jgi:formate hydrogenlyase subunit 6/NADH:ubiquinone oxidoreductase subunit I
MSYFSKIKRGITTTAKGLSLTFRHILSSRYSRGNGNIQDDNYFNLHEGRVTLQYPHETIDVPDHGRYQLDCEIDDCIVCDKCAKVCPVTCIDIEAIKSSELIRTTSDGSPVRLYAAKFDIDLAKCCFCGLCTTVCPTECLTMNSEYDYSVIDITDLNFAFSNLSANEAQQKRELYDQFVAEKELLKQAKSPTQIDSEKPKPAFKPSFVPKKTVETSNSLIEENKGISESKTEQTEATENTVSKPKPTFVPKFKPKLNEELVDLSENNQEESKELKVSEVTKTDIKPAFKPSFKPTIKPKPSDVSETKDMDAIKDDKPKAPFIPKLKPKSTEVSSNDLLPSDGATLESAVNKPSPSFKPSLKPKNLEAKLESENSDLIEKPKPKFVPTIKPKN